jgi:hypothetical protein
MRPAAIRRLLVFGVCLVGVGCLYLVPSMAGSPDLVGPEPGREDLTTATPATDPAATPLFPSPVLTQTSVRTTPASPTNVPVTITAPTDAERSDSRRATTRPRAAVTAVLPGRDQNPPAAVGRPTLVTADPEHLTISWPETDDDLGVASYRVWLNGFFVLATQQTRATLAWFNDSDTHVIQVRALDAAGNEGPSSPTLLVTRPTPPVPSPTQPPPTQPPPSTKPTLSASANPTEKTAATPDPSIAATSPNQTGAEGAEEDVS